MVCRRFPLLSRRLIKMWIWGGEPDQTRFPGAAVGIPQHLWSYHIHKLCTRSGQGKAKLSPAVQAPRPCVLRLYIGVIAYDECGSQHMPGS